MQLEQQPVRIEPLQSYNQVGVEALNVSIMIKMGANEIVVAQMLGGVGSWSIFCVPVGK